MNKFNLAGHRNLFFLLSAIIIAAGIACMCIRGFNFGIDFTGGTIIDLKFEKPVTIAEVRSSLAKYNLEGSTIQLSGENGAATDATMGENVMIRTSDLEENQRKDVMATLKSDVADYQVLREEKSARRLAASLSPMRCLHLSFRGH